MKIDKTKKNYRIAFYGGSFDPPHNGHLTIARKLTELFALDEFVFIPAFHAPHKKDRKPTSAFHRFAILALTTNDKPKMRVSKMELDAPEKPYTYETQTKLKRKLKGAEIFFVIGADSWQEIDTWREWERVLTLTNIIVVTRPGSEIGFSHVTEKVRKRTIDLREKVSGFKFQVSGQKLKTRNLESETFKIYITDAVNLDISSTEIRRKISAKKADWYKLVPRAVAKYIEKYELYI
ncbi:MAG: nicotinate-nucleotide adenylyltransferase [Acidobacteriota bacterium]|nr:nicotinate-nucleotide adenylyltransferase [Acidobacteriota bacterium]